MNLRELPLEGMLEVLAAMKTFGLRQLSAAQLYDGLRAWADAQASAAVATTDLEDVSANGDESTSRVTVSPAYGSECSSDSAGPGYADTGDVMDYVAAPARDGWLWVWDGQRSCACDGRALGVREREGDGQHEGGVWRAANLE